MEMTPDDEPNVDPAADALRERKRLQAQKDRDAKKQRREEESAEAARRVLKDTTNAQNRMARRDFTKVRELFGDDGRWVRFGQQVMNSPEMREAVMATARKIDPVPFAMADSARELIHSISLAREQRAAARMLMVATVMATNANKTAVSKRLNVSLDAVRKAARARKKMLAGNYPVLVSRSRNRRKDSLSQEHVALLNRFWVEHSRPTTHRRDVRRRPNGVTDGPEMVPLHFVEGTYESMYQLFCEKYPEVDANGVRRPGFTKFRIAKPWFVVPMTPKRRRTCCCTVHTKMEYTFAALYLFSQHLAAVHNGRTSRGHRRRGASVGVAMSTAVAGGGSNALDRAVIGEHLRVIRPILDSAGKPARLLHSADDEDQSILCKGTRAPSGQVHPRLDCVRGTCHKCGVPRVRRMMDSLLALCSPDDTITYTTWKKKEASKGSMVIVQEKVVSSPEDFVVVFMDTLFGARTKDKSVLKKVAEGKPHVHEYVTGGEARRYREGYVWHSFEAKFLTQQMLMDFDSFPYGEMRMGSDFAMNLALENDDALQAEHWSPQQVTMYVVIARVDAPDSTEAERKILTLHFHVFSDDTIHDSVAVRQFHEAIFGHLRDRGFNLNAVVWWSDGATAHFKSTPAFAGLHHHAHHRKGKEQVRLVRRFGASGHMKGPWDGANTYVKNRVKAYMLSHHAKYSAEGGIRSPRECFQWCRDNLSTVRSKVSVKQSQRQAVKMDERIFLYVEVNRNGMRPVTWNVDTNVHALHELHLEPGQPELHVRDLACCCVRCRKEDWGACEYGAWVLPPRHMLMKMKRKEAEALGMGCTCREARDSKCLTCVLVTEGV